MSSHFVPIGSNTRLERSMPRFAVIGSGISGLSAAWHLSAPGSGADVSLFEASSYLGGHANTVDVTLDGITHGVDTGFLVYNERTYPGLIALLDELGVARAPSAMSFSVQSPQGPGQEAIEWSGDSLDTVFAQRRNLLRPRFWSMLRDILRFNRLTTALATTGAEAALAQPIGEFLADQGFGTAFCDDYFLPMVACIWSCPTEQMLRFPMATMIRFCHNHGLLQVSNRPQWYTITGGSREYIRKMQHRLGDVRLNTPVTAVTRQADGVIVHTAQGQEAFDGVVMACHSDQALTLLGPQATVEERRLLGSIRYQPNRAVLHTDTGLLPQRRKAWAAWNYERAAQGARASSPVCLHYLINLLQPLPWQREVIVSLNPVREPAPRHVLREIAYEHPVLDQAAIDAQAALPSIQGANQTWYAGAWCGHGFHEDGFQAGRRAAQMIHQVLPTSASHP
jgi:predicted NAD/FAD-binding protein